jgi:hypothetical protein
MGWREYYVGGLYYLLTHLVPRDLSIDCELVWIVLLKINTFAWRLLSDRLSTKSNLEFCGCLHNDSASYEVRENFNHLFLNRAFFRSIWVILLVGWVCNAPSQIILSLLLINFVKITCFVKKSGCILK